MPPQVGFLLLAVQNHTPASSFGTLTNTLLHLHYDVLSNRKCRYASGSGVELHGFQG